MAIQVQALRFQQKQEGVNLYVTVLPAGQVLSHCKVDYFREENPRGYQRPLAGSRLKQISHYIRQEEGMLPTSILLCIRQPDRAQFEINGAIDDTGDWGLLTIPDHITLWVVDGQHRLYGIQRAFKKDGSAWARNYPLPVTIVEGISGYGEMRYFHVINTRQRGVPTDVVDRHLLHMRDVEESTLIDREGERGYLRARATHIVDLLRNSPDSPWFQRVQIANEKRRPNHLIRQHSMVASLEPALRDGFIQRLTDDEVGRLLINYWSAARLRWPRAFEEPQQYTIQKTAGIYALHMLFPEVVALCRQSQDFSPEKMQEVLAETGLTSGFWSREHGHPLTKETSAKFLRVLGQYLRERLPRPVLPRL